MRFLPYLLLPLFVVSCQTMSIEDEFADFEPSTSTQPESPEAKAMKMFAEYDADKKSAFDGKKFEGKEASLRSTYETKDYYKDHPYFKLHQNKDIADKVFGRSSAREGEMTAPWQSERDSWFKRTFTKTSANDRQKQVAKESARIPEDSRKWLAERNDYEGNPSNIKYEPMADPRREKKLTRAHLRSLLNSQ